MLDGGLGHAGTFCIYSILAFCGFIFVYFKVPETKGLSEKEKKELFIPGGKCGRKLLPNERAPGDSSESGQLDSDKFSDQLRAAKNNLEDSVRMGSSKRNNIHTVNESLLSSNSSIGPQDATL